jgi:hypothetical protein
LPRKKDHSPCFLSLWFPVAREKAPVWALLLGRLWGISQGCSEQNHNYRRGIPQRCPELELQRRNNLLITHHWIWIFKLYKIPPLFLINTRREYGPWLPSAFRRLDFICHTWNWLRFSNQELLLPPLMGSDTHQTGPNSSLVLETLGSELTHQGTPREKSCLPSRRGWIHHKLRHQEGVQSSA